MRRHSEKVFWQGACIGMLQKKSGGGVALPDTDAFTTVKQGHGEKINFQAMEKRQ